MNHNQKDKPNLNVKTAHEASKQSNLIESLQISRRDLMVSLFCGCSAKRMVSELCQKKRTSKESLTENLRKGFSIRNSRFIPSHRNADLEGSSVETGEKPCVSCGKQEVCGISLDPCNRNHALPAHEHPYLSSK